MTRRRHPATPRAVAHSSAFPPFRASTGHRLPSAPRAARAAAAALTLVVGAAACHARTGPSAAAAPDSLAVRRDIAYLASDRLEGRLTGTPANDTAAAGVR